MRISRLLHKLKPIFDFQDAAMSASRVWRFSLENCVVRHLLTNFREGGSVSLAVAAVVTMAAAAIMDFCKTRLLSLSACRIQVARIISKFYFDWHVGSNFLTLHPFCCSSGRSPIPGQNHPFFSVVTPKHKVK
jgi:hypothetical protein